MMPDVQGEETFAPFEIIITDDIILSNIPKDARSSVCSQSISTAEDDDLLDCSGVPQYVEVTPGNYYEIVESRWESENGSGFLDGSENSPNCVSQAPCPESDGLGYGSSSRDSEVNSKRPTRRGSLVMTLKRTSMHQEDIARKESVVSNAKPTIPFRRGSIVMSFEDSSDEDTQGPLILKRSQTAPIRPYRRASIVMNMAHSNEENDEPRPPRRRESLVLSLEDMEYEVAVPTSHLGRTESQCTVPPKYPSRKASMDMFSALDDSADGASEAGDNDQDIPSSGEGTDQGKPRSLVWTVTPSKVTGIGAEQISLKVSGFSMQREGKQKGERNTSRPKFPLRIGSMDMTSTSAA